MPSAAALLFIGLAPMAAKCSAHTRLKHQTELQQHWAFNGAQQGSLHSVPVPDSSPECDHGCRLRQALQCGPLKVLQLRQALLQRSWVKLQRINLQGQGATQFAAVLFTVVQAGAQGQMGCCAHTQQRRIFLSVKQLNVGRQINHICRVNNRKSCCRHSQS